MAKDRSGLCPGDLGGDLKTLGMSCLLVVSVCQGIGAIPQSDLGQGPWANGVEAPCIEPAWTLPHAPLPLADFKLSTFWVINHNRGCECFQQVL